MMDPSPGYGSVIIQQVCLTASAKRQLAEFRRRGRFTPRKSVQHSRSNGQREDRIDWLDACRLPALLINQTDAGGTLVNYDGIAEVDVGARDC